MRNPFDKVTWIKDYPGATDRYIEYTPVLRSDTSIQLGPTVGADFATLRFKDLDHDGIKETIIETELLIDFKEFRSPERHVLRKEMDFNGNPKFTLVSSELTGEPGFGN